MPPSKANRSKKVNGMRITKSAASTRTGLNFLKCAFAVNDFPGDPGMGIPDAYNGKVLCRRDTLTNALSLSAGNDVFILTLPTPGVAYWTCTLTAGTFPTATTSWSAVGYPGYFGGGGLAGTSPTGSTLSWSDDNVTDFRYASSIVGVYPNSNVMQTSGAIQAWRVNARFTTGERIVSNVPTSMQYKISGLEGVQVVPSENYTGKFLDGIYCFNTLMDEDFEFQRIQTGIYALPAQQPGGANPILPTELDQFGALTGPVGGLANITSTLIRIQCPTGSSNSAILRCWNCVEYQVNRNSVLYQYAMDSPGHDLLALQHYKLLARNLPLAVRADQNPDFWERVLNIIAKGGGFLSHLPGPIGSIAGILGTAASGIKTLAY